MKKIRHDGTLGPTINVNVDVSLSNYKVTVGNYQKLPSTASIYYYLM